MLFKENTGLVVIDIQGKLATLVHDSEALVANCEKLIKGAQILGLPIVWLEQNPDKLGSTVSSIRSSLKDIDPISKFTFDACQEPSFVSTIADAKVDNWLICGIEAHICVYQTALHMHQLGYKVQLVSDCISSRTIGNKQLGIDKLIAQGIDITGLEMCLYEMVKDCRAPEFKPILGMIR